MTDADIAAFAARVHVREDQALTSQVKGNFPARVRVQMRSGAVHDALVRDSKGSPGAPMSSAEIDDKFRSQVTDVLGVERCQQLLGRLRTLDTLGDIADLMPLLVQAR